MHKSRINSYDFSKYVKYYPNKSKAILEYRLDTGATTQSQLAHTKILEKKEKQPDVNASRR